VELSFAVESIVSVPDTGERGEREGTRRPPASSCQWV